MKLMDNGSPELDIKSDKSDIRMADMDTTDQTLVDGAGVPCSSK